MTVLKRAKLPPREQLQETVRPTVNKNTFNKLTDLQVKACVLPAYSGVCLLPACHMKELDSHGVYGHAFNSLKARGKP